MEFLKTRVPSKQFMTGGVEPSLFNVDPYLAI